MPEEGARLPREGATTPLLAPGDAIRLLHHLAYEAPSGATSASGPRGPQGLPPVAMERPLFDYLPMECLGNAVSMLGVAYKVYVSYYFLVAGLLVVVFGFNALLSTTYIIFAEKSRLLGVTVSLALTQSYLFSSLLSNTFAAVHDVWRPPPNECLHARRYLAYLLTAASWLRYHLFWGAAQGRFRRYGRDQVHGHLLSVHLLVGFGIPFWIGLGGFVASGTVTAVTCFTFTATVAALLLLALRFLCVWAEGMTEKLLWVRYGLLQLIGRPSARPPTAAPVHCLADGLEESLAAFGLDPRSMMLSMGFLGLIFCAAATYAALYASPEYQPLSDRFLVYSASALLLWFVYAWRPACWPRAVSAVLRCDAEADPDFAGAVHLLTATSLTLIIYTIWLRLTLREIGPQEPAYWGFLVCLVMVQCFFSRKTHKERNVRTLADAMLRYDGSRGVYDTLPRSPPISPSAFPIPHDLRNASPPLSGSDAGMVAGQPQTTLLLFLFVFLLLSVAMISIGQQIALPRYGPQRVAVTATQPTLPDPTRARYPVCGYRWIDNHFTILDFAFLSQLAYYSPENFRGNVETWYPGRNLTVRSSEREGTAAAIHQATFYDVFDGATGASIVVVRGTIDALDMLQDARIWGDSGLLGLFGMLGPFVSVWSLHQTTLYIRLSAIFSAYLRARSTNYMYDLEEYVKTIRPLRSEVILTGHSLGGGLAKLVSAKLHVLSVTFSSPGIVWARAADDPKVTVDDVDTYTTTVVPRGDLLANVDRHGGQLLYVDCPSSVQATRGLLGCHYLTSTICTLLRRCGDPDPLSSDWAHPRYGNRSLLGCTRHGTFEPAHPEAALYRS